MADNVFEVTAPKEPPKGTFEMALVLGGTVSSGAYTAGFLDKLVEALDAWYLAKKDKKDVPPHDVTIKVAAGASGGGVCAGILARVLGQSFPHVSPTSPSSDLAKNPFYSTWVQALDMKGFLKSGDIEDGKPLAALLNGEPIGKATEAVAEFTGGPLPGGWNQRPWVPNPFKAIVTLGNLTGVRYQIDFGNGNIMSYRAHADYASFACDISHDSSATIVAGPGEFLVQTNGTHPAVNWRTLASYARASGAFPIGLPACVLRRPTLQYASRQVAIPGEGGKVVVKDLIPDWSGTAVGAEYSFLCVDGGTFNNEPIELARQALAGLTGRNPRDPEKANRAVVLVDPLASTYRLGPNAFEGLLQLGGAGISALVANGRYETGDMMMMADPDVFSRYLVAPVRKVDDTTVIKGEKALATAALGAFLGFFEEEYRRHDYMLGRANCLEFLRSEFALSDKNPLFAKWTPGQKEQYGQGAGDGYLPVIPLVGTAALPDGPMPWPKGKLTAKRIRKMVEPRTEKVLVKVADDAVDNEIADALFWLLKGVAADPVLDRIEAEARQALADWDL